MSEPHPQPDSISWQLQPDHHGPWLSLGNVGRFEFNRIALSIPHLPSELKGLRILHLTDTHVTSRWMRTYDDLFARIESNPPDLFLFTGDFVDNRFDHRPALKNLARFISRFSARLGIFAITGNHDTDLLGPHLPTTGINLINRRFVELESRGAKLELIGLPGVARGPFDADFLSIIPPRDFNVPRIVLGHFPDQILQIESMHADLMLAGHTHGGQVCFPDGRPIITHDKLPKSQSKGVFRFGNTALVVNRGLGFATWPVRLFCPAEVIEIEFV